MIIEPGENPLAVSDEDFLNMTPPPVTAPAVAEGEGEKETTDPAQSEEQDDDTTEEIEGGDDDEAESKEGDKPAEGEKPKEKEKPDELEAGKKVEEGDKLSKDKSQEGKDKPTEGTKEKDPTGSKPEGEKVVEKTPADYEAFYKKIMAPLHANGKKIELRTPEEAIQLMQQGANYTRKMQAIAPHRKILLMLENNGLLDEGKLSFLIDIEKKNPEAIKKLVKDAGIDPLEIDTREDSNYREGNHRVSDDEASFRAVLDDISSTPEGRETLKQINTQWDQASKDILWKQPDVMQLIHQHREEGIFDVITTEMERLRALGQIPANVPYLHAYKKIGDDLAAAGAFKSIVEKPSEEKPAASHVATRVQKVKPAAPNGDKANAAAISRTASKKAETIVNPLAMSDEEFEKQFAAMQGRV